MRREIAELAFRVLAKRPWVISVPASVFRADGWGAGLASPRLGELSS
jgi:hypothetical protein